MLRARRFHGFGSSAAIVAGFALVGGCATPRGGSSDEKRSYVQDMRAKAMDELYASRGDLRQKVEKAAGYGVFSNVDLQLLFISTGHGFGIVHDNRTGKETYMRMAAGGVGFGAGLKDLRAVFVFNDPKMMDRFVEYGWEFGAEAEAGAKAGDKGGAAGTQANAGTGTTSAGAGAEAEKGAYTSTSGGVEVYQLTNAGVTLRAAIEGTKYWKDGELNP